MTLCCGAEWDGVGAFRMLVCSDRDSNIKAVPGSAKGQ